MKCEKAINPLLDDDDAVSFAYILNMIVDARLKKVEHVSHRRRSACALTKRSKVFRVWFWPQAYVFMSCCGRRRMSSCLAVVAGVRVHVLL